MLIWINNKSEVKYYKVQEGNMTNFSTDDNVREVIIDSKSETIENIKESEEWSDFAKGIIRIAIFLFETAVINMAF